MAGERADDRAALGREKFHLGEPRHAEELGLRFVGDGLDRLPRRDLGGDLGDDRDPRQRFSRLQSLGPCLDPGADQGDVGVPELLGLFGRRHERLGLVLDLLEDPDARLPVAA